jgi:hypothetical protein
MRKVINMFKNSWLSINSIVIIHIFAMQLIYNKVIYKL